MNKRVLSVTLAVTMLLMTLLSVFTLQASAASGAKVTLTSAAARMGEEVEVAVQISENSYLTNADMYIQYDASKLELVADAYDDPITEGEKSCYTVPDGFFDGYMFQGSKPKNDGQFIFLFATGSDRGFTKGGEMFRMKFKIIADDVESTTVELASASFGANNGGEDYTMDYTVEPAVVTIVDANPTTTTTKPEPVVKTEWLLMEEYITSGRENVTINADGSWTLTGPVTLTPNLDYDYNELPYVSLHTDSTVPYSIVVKDAKNSLNENLSSNWNSVAKPTFPAGEHFNATEGMKEIYDWKVNNSSFPDPKGKAQITTVTIALSGTGSLTIKSLALTSEQKVVSKPTTTTTESTTTTTESTTTTTESTTTTTESTEPPVFDLGDVNGDGVVNMEDAMDLYDAVSGFEKLEQNQKDAGDMDGDGQITLKDALYLYLVNAGVLTVA